MSSHRDEKTTEQPGVNRRSFLQTSGGVATGLAVTIVPPAAAAAALVGPAAAEAKTGRPVQAQGDVPSEPVVAYVHDADKGHVTVVSGTSERTYHDPALAKRLLDAAAAVQTA